MALEGKYTVDREIGRGGAARVFSAKDANGDLVALKVLHPQLAVSVTAERFLREIAFLEKIDHPNIAGLIDAGESEFLVYYVMEFIEGPTAREHMTRLGAMEVVDSVKMGNDLLSALRYAHERGIVHRDVKPENIVLSDRGAVLLDFGIARAVAQSGTDRLTRSGFAVGTSSYMSPEQIEGADDLDHRSDIYSVGCVLFESIAGSPPFAASHEDLVLRMHLDPADRPNLAKAMDDVPNNVVEAVNRALEHEREDRWQSAEEMKEALGGALP
jgi:serine/threonine-protein kinase